jgi:hypothetical protein
MTLSEQAEEVLKLVNALGQKQEPRERHVLDKVQALCTRIIAEQRSSKPGQFIGPSLTS